MCTDTRIHIALLTAFAFVVGCNDRFPTETPDPPPPVRDAGVFPDLGFIDPDAGPVVTAARPPLPISGGTLLALRSGAVVAADADRDRVWIVDVVAHTVSSEIELGIGAEPGRLAEDAAGRVHVVLRGTGQLATIDPAMGTVLERRTVCVAPRGVAWDDARSRLLIACASGELVTLPATGGVAEAHPLRLDLRDVVVSGGAIYVSLFREGSVLRLLPDLSLDATLRPDDVALSSMTAHTSGVAWRMLAAPSGGVIVVHQRAVSSVVDVVSSGYSGGECRNGIVESAVTLLDGPPGTNVPAVMMMTVLPVDGAIGPDGMFAVAAPASFEGFEVVEQALTSLAPGCMSPGGLPGSPADSQIVAVAYTPDAQLVTQSREPAGLWLPRSSTWIAFAGAPSVRDTGNDMFHQTTPSMVACASCHPEGGEDGHTWNFGDVGERRTQTVLGGVLATAPFHWSGDMVDMRHIMDGAFTQRMGAGLQDDAHVDAIAAWLDAQPLPHSPTADAATAARGAALFASSGCASCHAGSGYTNNANADVSGGSRGPSFQVPSLLGVAYRAPYLHDGCAQTLRDTVTGCGPRHAFVTTLTPADLDAVTAFLTTL